MYTVEEYNKKLDEKYKTDKYEVYKSNNIIKDRDRILVRCKGCGTIKEVNARSFIRLVAKTDKFPGKLECKICRQKRKDAEKAAHRHYTEEIISGLLAPRYTILEYNGADNMLVKCNTCGNIFNSRYYELKSHKGCINCNGRKAYSIDELQKKTDEKFGSGITILSIYQHRFKSCVKRFVKVSYNGKIYKKSESEFLRYGIRLVSKRNINYWKDFIDKKYSGVIELQSNKYITKKTVYKFYNKKLGTYINISLDNALYQPELLLSPNSLGYSRFALATFKKLNEMHEYFIPEVKLHEKSRQRFDIYLKNLNKYIEIDGQQHFEKNSGWGEEAFKNTISRDACKNEFCRKKNKTLLRIPYTEIKKGNLNNILTSYINNDYKTLLSYNILLVNDKKIFNENTYYEPTRCSLIKLLVENLSNCWKLLRA